MPEKKRKNEILTVAANLFAQKGYERTTIQDITGAIGLNQGVFYYYFPDKQTLLYSAMDSGLQTILPKARKIAKMKVPPAAKFELLIKNHITPFIINKAVPTIATYEMRNLSAKLRKKYIAFRDAYEAIFREVITNGIAEGQFREVDVQLMSAFILGLLNSVIAWYRNDGRCSPDQMAVKLLDFILPALKYSAPNSADSKDISALQKE